MLNFAFRQEDSNNVSLNGRGKTSALFTLEAKDYPYWLDVNGTWIVLDTLDGRLINFTQSLDVIPVPAKSILPADVVCAKAQAFYREWRNKYPLDDGVVYEMGDYKLAYTVPQDRYGVRFPGREAPYKAPLAYNITFGKDVLYYDAQTGELLGGVETPRR